MIISRELARLVPLDTDLPAPCELELALLAEQLAQLHRIPSAHQTLLFGSLSGHIRRDELLLALNEAVAFDSVVRDIMATGHLGKLLCREPVCRRLTDWRVAAFPHSFFDRISWRERRLTMKWGVCHDSDLVLFEHPEVRAMLMREEHVWKVISRQP